MCRFERYAHLDKRPPISHPFCPPKRRRKSARVFLRGRYIIHSQRITDTRASCGYSDKTKNKTLLARRVYFENMTAKTDNNPAITAGVLYGCTRSVCLHGAMMNTRQRAKGKYLFAARSPLPTHARIQFVVAFTFHPSCLRFLFSIFLLMLPLLLFNYLLLNVIPMEKENKIWKKSIIIII